MALDDSDNFIVQGHADSKLYRVEAGMLQKRLLDGDPNNQNLVWSGGSWVPGTIDGGVYATVRVGLVSSIESIQFGTGISGVRSDIPVEGGTGTGLTVEYRYSSGVLTPGTLAVHWPGEGYAVGDEVTVLDGNNDKVVRITGIYEEARNVNIY